MDPLFTPQSEGAFPTKVRFNGSGPVISIEFSIVQPLESEIVTVYTPASKLEIIAVASPLLQLNVYGGTPPVVLANISPSVPLSQLISNPLKLDRIEILGICKSGGFTSVTLAVAVQSNSSVTVTV